MIRKILSLVTVLSMGSLVAQNLELNDANDNSIDGLTHYIYDTGLGLAETKFHVANSSASPIIFDAVVQLVANPTNVDLQVCFGTNCFVASDGITVDQTFSDVAAVAPASGSYNDFKVAPFSFGWATGNFGVWKVRAVNTANASDETGAYIVWTAGGTFAGDQNSNTIVDGNEIAGDIDGNGIIDGNEITGDMNGNGVIDVWEIGGDANGNGIIDNGEIVSIAEFSERNVQLSAYPNPVLNNLTINYAIEGDAGNARIEVRDVLGQRVKDYVVKSGKGSLSVDVSQLNAGVYFYTIKIGDQSIRTERVIVQ